MNLMWLAYHLHVKMIDLTKVCMLFYDEPLTHRISVSTLKKVAMELD
jgi:hypothetical protein